MKRLSHAVLLAVFSLSYLNAIADPVVNAAAAAAANQAVTVGTLIFLRNEGYQPQIVTNPNGMTSVVTGSGNNTDPASAADAFAVQNQQDAKNAFFSGS